MDAMNVLENSYYVINKNFNFYKKKNWTPLLFECSR